MGFLNRLTGKGIAPAFTAVGSATNRVDAFVAIDFETANNERASACAVGLSRFENGTEVERDFTLIAPGIADEEWEDFCIGIHGIRPEDVVGAASFREMWTEFEARYAGLPLVAHNAAFDMGVLRAEFARAKVRPARAIRYTCSASMARCAWPHFLCVSLPIVADELGIELNHHEPSSDAHASGQVVLHAVEALGAADLDDALARTGRSWGRIEPNLTWVTGLPLLKARDCLAPAAGVDERHPLYGKTIVFTGRLDSMTRREAFQAIADVGATPGDGVTAATNVLVTGEQDIHRLAAGQTLSNNNAARRTCASRESTSNSWVRSTS